MVTLLFGAIDGTEKRKGFSELIRGHEGPAWKMNFSRSCCGKTRLRLLCFGSPSDQLENMGIPVVSLGRLGTDEDIRECLLGRGSLYMLPSLEDNLPNTILESMSCATPVVAFNVGGVSDMVTDGVNGLLVKAFDTQQMGEAIVTLALDPEKRLIHGKSGSRKGRQGLCPGCSGGKLFEFVR